ncbi:T9SS type A sorting domain-containing protein [Gaetbulibacter sp. NE]|uniref:T9SS type A sorting domain-containing protein n=1 Tax=Gaetbulibacter sp. NE TaxID=2982307 RepID=UPI0021CDF256|nr:T9SS type A sorting domain-containing protein [Gaetbulibacter sp. NE]
MANLMFRFMIRKLPLSSLLIFSFCIYSFSQTNNCNNLASGEITVSTSCNPVSFNSNNNTNYWDGATGCNAGDFDDAWGWFVATSNSTTIIYNTSDNNRDPILTLFTGGCNTNMTSIACADDGLDGDSETINYATTPGVTYRVRIQDWNSNSNMNGTICVYSSTPPSNDNCGGINLTSNLLTCNNTSGTTVDATPSGLTSCYFSNANDDVWYNFTALTDTHTITVTEGTLDDAVFEIFSGTCGSLTSELCVDDYYTNESAEITGFTPGNTYYIRVHSYGNNPGTFDICITHPCLPGNGTGTTALACPSVDVMDSGGNDTATINCTSPSSVDLEANYLELGETTSYNVESIAYNPPYQFDCLANPVSVNTDDVWSPTVNLPFDFCFYGQTYNSCVIGSNGVISFDSSLAGGPTGWRIDNNLPNNVANASNGTTDYFYGPSIFGVHHDIDPSAGGEIAWELITLNTGCRALVAAWSDVPMYDSANWGDGSVLYSGMIVFYENTNVIEIYIEEKQLDDSPFVPPIWNNGRAQVGLQNNTGTLASAAPGRNDINTTWTATNEAWRFVPSGSSITDLKWYANSISPANEIIDPDDDGIITVSPTSTTTYIAEVTYNLCNSSTIVETDNFIVTVNGVKIWDGSEATNDWMEPLNWSDDTIPTSADCVVIPITGNDPVLYTNNTGDGLNLTVHDGATLTVQSDASVTIVDFVDIQGVGTIQINSSGSLIQVNDVPTVPNTGNITMNRDANIRGTDYVYWSSPVNNFNVNNVSLGTSTNYIYEWITTIPNGFTPPPVIPICFGNWSNSAGSLMQNGKGYIVRGPDAFTNTPATFTATFNGVANNGIITKTINSGTNTNTNSNFSYNPYGNDLLTVTPFDDNWNLLGNPYPSALDAQAFLTHPNNTIIEGAVHIWTHGSILGTYTDSFYEDYVLNYNISDYVTYNFSGTNTYQDESFSGQIASGQGFFVLALNDSETGSVTFNNSMRQLSASYDNSQFYRTQSSNNVNYNTESSLEKHRIWLNLVSPSQLSSSILVGYIEGATNQKDRLYDAYNKEFNALNLYSKIDDKGMIIQGRALPFDQNDQVHLGTVLTEPGIHTIAISNVDGLFTNEDQNIYLEDTYTNTIHDLKISPYIFSVSQPTTFDDRFILRYTNETLDIDKDDVRSQLSISAPNGDYIKVKSETNTIDSVIIYDLLGRKLFEQKNINQLEFIIQDSNLSDATYIVKATLTQSKKQKIQRIILKQ